MLLIPMTDYRQQYMTKLFSNLAIHAPNLFQLVKQPAMFESMVVLDFYLKHSFPSEQEKLKEQDPSFFQKLTSTLNPSAHLAELSELIEINQTFETPVRLDDARLATMTYLDWLITAGTLHLRRALDRKDPVDPATQAQLDRISALSPPFVVNKKLRPLNALLQQVRRKRDQRSFWLELTGFISLLTSAVLPLGLIITAGCAFTYKRVQQQYQQDYQQTIQPLHSFDQQLIQLDMVDYINSLLDLRNEQLLQNPLFWLLCYRYVDTAPQHFEDKDLDLLLRTIPINPKTALSLISNLTAKEIPDILHPTIDIDIYQKLQSGFNSPKQPIWLVGKDKPNTP